MAVLCLAPLPISPCRSIMHTTTLFNCRYRFYIGRGICSKCGTKGHLAGTCTTEYCRSCKKMGHATGECHLACSTCFKDHSRPNSCSLKNACRTCGLWGHTVAGGFLLLHGVDPGSFACLLLGFSAVVMTVAAAQLSVSERLVA
jgi:hypothetical protein